MIWTDLLLFLTIYYSLSGLYRLFLDDSQKIIFERVVEFFRSHTSQSPLSFVLGFYVSVVMTRWWNQYISIPWPDSIAVFVSGTIHGNDERGRLMRRTIMRFIRILLLFYNSRLLNPSLNYLIYSCKTHKIIIISF